VKVVLLRSTPDPEKTVTLAAKLCYSGLNIGELEDAVGKIDCGKFLDKIIKMGHTSVLEHASFTFGVEGVSRVTSHQLVRHRIASYSQQSQRYVKLKKEFVAPPAVSRNRKMARRFKEFIAGIHDFYEELCGAGIPVEDARYILPNAASTKIIVTMNARELVHFFTLRCCERAQWEIREMATRMLRLTRKAAPSIFKESGPSCVRGPCREGEFTCGRPKEIREKFRKL
jgi:thymidylate synthase (FAD)